MLEEIREVAQWAIKYGEFFRYSPEKILKIVAFVDAYDRCCEISNSDWDNSADQERAYRELEKARRDIN